MIPWDKSTNHIEVGGNIYDIVESHKNTGLDSVAEYIMDNSVVVKQPINESAQFQTFVQEVENKTGVRVQELLFG